MRGKITFITPVNCFFSLCGKQGDLQILHEEKGECLLVMHYRLLSDISL